MPTDHAGRFWKTEPTTRQLTRSREWRMGNSGAHSEEVAASVEVHRHEVRDVVADAPADVEAMQERAVGVDRGGVGGQRHRVGLVGRGRVA